LLASHPGIDRTTFAFYGVWLGVCKFRGNFMSDPVTIGVLVASALAMAAEAVVKTGVGEVVKDAYHALKAKIAAWCGSDVEALADEPTSKGDNLLSPKWSIGSRPKIRPKSKH
jgi:hypothetical protein